MVGEQAMTRRRWGDPAVPRIPGVVDGMVSAVVDPDGSVTFHIVIGASDAVSRGGDRIEVTVRREDANLLGATLLGTDRKPGMLPCQVGVRLGRCAS